MIYLFPTFLMRAPDFDASVLPDLGDIIEELLGRARAVVDVESTALQAFIADDREGSERQTLQAHYACIIESVAMARWATQRLGAPKAISGYSMGLYSAVAYSGALEFENALTLARDICTTAHMAMGDRRWATGAVVGFSSPRVRELVAQATSELEVTDQCGSATILFTGPAAAVKPVLDQCLAEGAPLTRLIPVTAPFHTTVLEDVKPRIEALLAPLTVRAPSCPIVSAITQDLLITAQDIRDEFGRNILRPMNWQATMARVMQMAPGTVLEAGASSVLCDVVRDDHPQQCAVLDWRALSVQAA